MRHEEQQQHTTCKSTATASRSATDKSDLHANQLICSASLVVDASKLSNGICVNGRSLYGTRVHLLLCKTIPNLIVGVILDYWIEG